MKVLIPLAVLLLGGCASVDRVGPYELAPAKNPPRMTVQPTTVPPVYETRTASNQ